MIWSIMQQTAFCRGIPAEDIQALFTHVRYVVRSYTAKEVVFSENDLAEYVGIVLSGKVEVQKLFSDGKVVLVSQLGEGGVFGEAAVLSESVHYPVTIYCRKQSELLLIDKPQLLKLLSLDSRVLENFLKQYANRLFKMNQQIELLSQSSMRQKIVFYLLTERRKQAAAEHIELPFSQRAWAEYMNVSRPSLSRELKRMNDEGLLQIEKRRIKLYLI
ncbi:Crp/Fnr family transcriptional regulator [Desulfosporosinus youngiae]|uniref:cAMP-binding protein n=1 Tax=Desulfosporosinus youngiae DSM 17734 TaxID=768710 RepID=H5Y4P7_9FIRM|nr:Crp/Fnr family transcriptional regulator [Desulfosporosinus youngiae]EHQ89783.1 cAMP-binding protein [Desulfosporosinus youngiae DSM 17734]